MYIIWGVSRKDFLLRQASAEGTRKLKGGGVQGSMLLQEMFDF